MADDAPRISRDAAEGVVASALCASGVAERNARSVSRAIVAAEIDGQKGHGFARVTAYCEQARTGKVVGDAVPQVESVAPAFVRVDACHGFAYPAIDAAIEALTDLAPKNGLAGAAIVRSHHSGQLGAHVERCAERGLVALMVANTPKAMAPWGGRSPLFGTNPIAFAAPFPDEPPLVIDLSLSKVARGKVMAAAKTDEQIPEGWAFDSEGRPTTDPGAALEGAMVPMGDAKGAALALMVEILAATLTGANHSDQASSFFDAEGVPPGVGQMILAFDPVRILGGCFAARLVDLAARIQAQEGARLPGVRRLRLRAEAELEGVSVDPRLLRELASFSERGKGG